MMGSGDAAGSGGSAASGDVTEQTRSAPGGATALRLAEWAHAFAPDEQDLALAERSLRDTLAVTLAARSHPLVGITRQLGEAGHWAAIGHVLDFDDLHIESTTHISVVIVPTVLATGGDARAYLIGAGVMARLGLALGWHHYQRRWHATCTAGAPAAAAAASIALGLDVEETAHAIALSVPAAGGMQEAFGTTGKPIQVGFAADAGVRAARLARSGARTDLRVLDAWLTRVGASGAASFDDSPESASAVPGGLAIKLFPCCYAMQRPIGVMRALRSKIAATPAARIEQIVVTTPAGTVHPLIHSRPRTGLEGKFSLEYSLAAALLDEFPDFTSFTDAAVNRAEAQTLIERVVPELEAAEVENLLAGDCEIEVLLSSGARLISRLDFPPGSPRLPATEAELTAKFRGCGPDVPALLAGASGSGIGWREAAALLRSELPVTA